MIDDLLGAVFDELFGFVPTAVWGFLFLVGGVAAAATGVITFSKSGTVGGVLIAAGMLVAGAVLVEWYR